MNEIKQMKPMFTEKEQLIVKMCDLKSSIEHSNEYKLHRVVWKPIVDSLNDMINYLQIRDNHIMPSYPYY